MRCSKIIFNCKTPQTHIQKRKRLDFYSPKLFCPTFTSCDLKLSIQRIRNSLFWDLSRNKSKIKNFGKNRFVIRQVSWAISSVSDANTSPLLKFEDFSWFNNENYQILLFNPHLLPCFPWRNLSILRSRISFCILKTLCLYWRGIFCFLLCMFELDK